MAQQPNRELKCLLLPMRDAGLLVPNALVAEIVTQQSVTQVPATADWLLGRGSWRGTDVPLISFDRLCGFVDVAPEPGGRYVILYSLEPDRQPAYYGVRIDALPRSETVDADRLVSRSREADDPGVIALRGELGDRACVVPDLDALTAAVRKELATETA